jgi:ribosomal protein L11 methyltransferase
MNATGQHLRWRLSVPDSMEDGLSEWLQEQGATATYRDADPPKFYYAYFQPDTEGPDPGGLEAFPGVVLESTEYFGDEDWIAKSREGFGSFAVGTRFFIRPLWDQGSLPFDRFAITVNPGLAFGTGGHETTRLCMELLEQLAKEGKLKGPILDIGAGTGILSLTAYLLGVRGITAFDIDPDCGPAMTEFIQMNEGLGGPAPFDHFVGDLEDKKIHPPYRGLLANILLLTIQDLLPRMAEIAEPGGWLIASGILAECQDEALVSLATQGFKPLRMLSEGAWIAILAERV